MEKSKVRILYTTMSSNIGQVRREDAQKEVDRLNKQQNTNKWTTDDSEQMFVVDESDIEMSNPCTLSPGYVWVIKL